jgi:cation diffusion facilitator family transporter
MDPGVRVTLVAILLNLALAAAKFSVGIAAGSEALVADGFNSAGDVVATIIGLAGYWYGRRPADEGHPFGHGNAESVAALVIGGILLATGVFVALDGLRALLAATPRVPEPLALGVALATAAIKEGLARATLAVGRRLNSPSLLASAADHRADVVIAFTVAAGIAGARMGVPALDPLAALLVGGWIVRLGITPVRSAFGVLMDAAPADVTAAARAVAERHPDVLRVDLARVHPLGSYYVVDLEIAVAPETSLRAAHAVAHQVEADIRAGVQHVREVRVHVNPG